MAQSLFAIGTGGWFGLGLCQGLRMNPGGHDGLYLFCYSRREAQELSLRSASFDLCQLFHHVSPDIAIPRSETASPQASSAGTWNLLYFQVFLAIGGVIKFIPSTGVTLPCELWRKFPFKYDDRLRSSRGYIY